MKTKYITPHSRLVTIQAKEACMNVTSLGVADYDDTTETQLTARQESIWDSWSDE